MVKRSSGKAGEWLRLQGEHLPLFGVTGADRLAGSLPQLADARRVLLRASGLLQLRAVLTLELGLQCLQTCRARVMESH